MKKIKVVLSIILILGLITGCGCNKKEIDKEEKTNKELNIEMQKISIKESKIFEGLDILNDNTLETQIGINRNFVENHAIGISMYGSAKEIYMIVKPKEENKKILKEALDLYIERTKENANKEDKTRYENVLKQEYNGYYVYIVSEDNENIFNQIKEYLK